MFWILLLLYFCNITASHDENNKYIDLLPEKEKSEFLERIARRILKEIKSKKVPQDSHAEISDEQLNEHTAYVQGLMKEEVASLKNKNDWNNRKNNGFINDTQNPQNDKVINDNIENERKREKRTDIDVQPLDTTQLLNETTIIPLKPVYDQNFEYGNVEESTNKETITTTIKPEAKNSTTENIIITSSLTKVNTTPVSQSINKYNTTNLGKSNLNHTEPHNQTIVTSTMISKSLQNNSENANKTRRTLENSTNILTSITPKSSQVHYVKTKYSGPNQRLTVFDEYSNSSDNVLSSTQKVHEVKEHNSKNSNEDEYTKTTSISTSTVSTSTVVDVDLNKGQSNYTYFNTDKSIEINSTYLNTNLTKEEFKTYNLEVDRNQTRDVIFEKELNGTNLQIHNSTHNTNFGYSKLATKAQEHLNKPKVMNRTVVNNQLDVENRQGNKLPMKINDYKNTGLTNIGNITTHVNNAKKIMKVTQDKSTKLPKTYEVYEVVPDSAFMRTNKIEYVSVQEQPYYVPVYNYDPDNAYFNPYNRYGQNSHDVEDVVPADDADEIEVSKSRFESRSDKYTKKSPTFKSSISDTLNYLHDIIRPPKKKPFHDIQFNPNDYFDIDYYAGRGDNNRKRSPDSIEDVRPYNNKHESPKDIIRAVRKFTYMQKMVGRIPLNKQGVADALIDDGQSVDEGHSTPPNGNLERYNTNKIPISMDYYFERTFKTQPDSNVDTIMPLTENPILTGMFKGSKIRREPVIMSSVLKFEKNVNFNYNALLKVFKDMIETDNEALVGYDWLQSTVDIRVGATKLIDLMQNYTYNNHIHSKDLELLKYVLYLYTSSLIKINKETNSFAIGLSLDHPKPKRQLPQTKQKFIGKNLKRDIRRNEEYDQQESILFGLEDFLQEVLFQLDDFHRAIKKIAITKTYRTQDWYNDIRRAYFKRATDHQLGSVLLHLSVTRVFRLIDASAGRVQKGFREYVKEHRKEEKRTKKEFIFLLKVLDELRYK